MFGYVNWSKIKEGFRGFEKLAVAFVQDQYPNDTWKKTKETRDGNKDATAIILGYQGNSAAEIHWWMEAKYSQKKTLPRYRLDATIVSAVREGNISQIIFVTNTQIETKTVTDIRIALKKAIACESVRFCTKHILEYWLFKNQNIYHHFFDDKNKQLKEPDFCITQEISFYELSTKYLNYKEPLNSLQSGRKYIGYFSVFSPDTRKIHLKVSHCISGVNILSDKCLSVPEGESQKAFIFFIENTYSHTKENDIPVLQFEIDGIPLRSTVPIVPVISDEVYFDIPSQCKEIDALYDSYKYFVKKKQYCFHMLIGCSGVGKTYIINQFIQRINIERIIRITFSESQKLNAKELVAGVFNLFFPYIDSRDMGEEYINSMPRSDTQDFLRKLYSSINQFEDLMKSIKDLDLDDMQSLFHISINSRILVFDDIQYLNAVLTDFLDKILYGLIINKIPVFVIQAAHENYIHSDAYHLLNENISMNEHVVRLTSLDIISCIPSVNIAPSVKKNNFVILEDLHVLELLMFAKFIVSEDRILNDFDQIITSFRIFHRSNSFEEYATNKFRKFFAAYPKGRMLCDLIYWSYTPIKESSDSKNAAYINYMLAENLIKLDSNNHILPYHDTLKKIYHKHFFPKDIEKLGFLPKSIEYLKFSVNTAYSQMSLEDIIQNEVFPIFDQKKYNTILYIMDDVFNNITKESLKRKLSPETYYQLYLIYGLSALQQSWSKINIRLFKEIYNETKNTLNPQVLEIAIKTKWELSNISFVELDYEKSLRINNEILDLTKKEILLTGYGLLEDQLSYYDVQVMNFLIAADRSEKMFLSEYRELDELIRKHHFDYRAESFRARYALTLCHKDMKLCIDMLKAGKNSIGEKYGNEDKHYIWCDFYYKYYSLIYKNEFSLINQILQSHEKLKENQLFNYRRKLCSIALVFYKNGDITNGDKILFKDTYFLGNTSKRYRGFFCEALILHELFSNNHDNVQKYTNEAVSIFSKFDSYKKIPMHNMKVLRENDFQPKHIQFWMGETLQNEIYYIDPRAAW